MIGLTKTGDSFVIGKANKVRDMVKEGLSEGQDIEKVLNEGLIFGMDIVGDKFQKNEFYIPEMLIDAGDMKAEIEILKPILVQKDIKSLGKMILDMVRGDLRDIGKTLVGTILEVIRAAYKSGEIGQPVTLHQV